MQRGSTLTAYEEAAVIIRRLAETIDEDELREGFLTAVHTQPILEASKNSETTA